MEHPTSHPHIFLVEPDSISVPYLLSQHLDDLTWDGYRHIGNKQKKVEVMKGEFFGLENPVFLFYHEEATAQSQVRGFLAIERSIHSIYEGKRSAFWESLTQKYPEILQLSVEEPLQLSIISGIVVDPIFQKEGIGKALMTVGLSLIHEYSDIILGLTKNPAAVRLRKKILAQVSGDAFDLWVGRTSLTSTTPDYYPKFVQELTDSYVRFLGGRMDQRAGYEDVAIIPQPYLPKPFHVASKEDLFFTERKWIGRLFDVEKVIGEHEVAVHGLIAMGRKFRQLYPMEENFLARA